MAVKYEVLKLWLWMAEETFHPNVAELAHIWSAVLAKSNGDLTCTMLFTAGYIVLLHNIYNVFAILRNKLEVIIQFNHPLELSVFDKFSFTFLVFLLI